MEPSLLNGQVWLAIRGRRFVRVNDVVVFVHPLRPDFLEVKRVISKESKGWWVEGDNQDDSTDSRSFGLIDPSSVRGKIWRQID